MQPIINIYYIIIAIAVLGTSCKKQDDFLNQKRQNSDVVPTTLSDFQAILDNTSDSYANTNMNTYYPTLGLLGADNYYLTDAVYASQVAPANTAYIWSSDIYQGYTCIDWNQAYTRVEYSNIVLDGIASISVNSSNQAAYNNAKGSALFYRSFDFYNIAGLFCKPYIATSAKQDLGIVLRTTSDINSKSTRASVQETYDQIINDLKLAITLLPIKPANLTRPSIISATALLAKIYLSMEDYSNAYLYADQALKLKGDLIDFNNSSLVHATGRYAFPTDPSSNPEMIYFAEGSIYLTIYPYIGRGYVDSTLYASYDNSDLRKTVLYLASGGLHKFRGTYDCYAGKNFAGIATNEIYLIRAESAARLGNISVAMTDLNNLLSHRYTAGAFLPITAVDQNDAVNKILIERRKELPFTASLRWEDLRRLNKDPKYATTLKRVIGGIIYTLSPNDPKYVYPIATDELQLSGIMQNPR